jgi:hypothetical protein
VSRLCAQAGERARVGDVGAGLVSTTAAASTGFTATATTTLAITTTTALAAATTSAELAASFATTASLAATVFTAATTTSLAAAEVATAFATTTAASSATALTGRGSKHAVAVELNVDLLLALALTLGLGVLAGHVGLLLLLAGQSFALGELLAAALVGLADVLGGERELLLGLLDQVGGVGLAVVFRLGLGLVLGLGSIGDSLLLFSLSNGVTGLLIGKLSVAVVAAPAVSSLLLVLAVIS